MKSGLFSLSLILLIFTVASCKKETIIPDNPGGKLEIHFNHTFGNRQLITDSLCYVNKAGNALRVDELKYFISDVVLHSISGNEVHIDAETAVHYVDLDYPSTLNWKVFDPIPEGIYDSISFVFGLNEQRNISFAFINPPEVNMFWPSVLGGGYHYLMINGMWINAQNEMSLYNFHLGIGQHYSGITTSADSITGFVQNYFRVHLPLPALQISPQTIIYIQLCMNVESWFETPNTWDFNYWGGNIMQNQTAMSTACANGRDVFSIDSAGTVKAQKRCRNNI